jgi:hypothetical protein
MGTTRFMARILYLFEADCGLIQLCQVSLAGLVPENCAMILAILTFFAGWIAAFAVRFAATKNRRYTGVGGYAMPNARATDFCRYERRGGEGKRKGQRRRKVGKVWDSGLSETARIFHALLQSLRRVERRLLVAAAQNVEGAAGAFLQALDQHAVAAVDLAAAHRLLHDLPVQAALLIACRHAVQHVIKGRVCRYGLGDQPVASLSLQRLLCLYRGALVLRGEFQCLGVGLLQGLVLGFEGCRQRSDAGGFTPEEVVELAHVGVSYLWFRQGER